MALVDELAKLHEVQKVDTQIYQREQALKALDNGNTQKQAAIALMKRHDAAQAELHKLEAAQKNRELELKSLEQKKQVVHEKLYSGRITNPKELADLQKDEDMLSEQIGRVEEAVLEAMEQAEGARTTTDALGGDVAVAKRKYQQTIAHFQQESARLQQEIAALRPQRDAAAALVEKPLLRRYDEIRQGREGIGMAVTGSDICPICHIRLTNQTVTALHAGETLTLCESCGRILAWLV